MKSRVITVVAALAFSASTLLATQDVHACDSCNLKFAQELLEERSETLAGQDMLRVMRHHAALETGSAAAAATVASAASVPTTPSRVAGSRSFDEMFGDSDFIEIIRRDEGLSIAPTSYVSQDVEPDKEFTVILDEGKTYIGQGVMYDGFLTDGAVPGQTIIVQEGDIVRMNVENRGTVPHGASIHAADTQTSKYVGNIGPGETKSVTFRAMVPGVYMYHCAPGGHAIPMHVLFGQYGMIVVEPKETKYKLEEELGHGPDLTVYLTQHEFYASGRDAVEGSPLYTAFNGKVFRYVEEPIVAKPGDYVRVHFLNVGPNLVSTFHLVGIVWDYVYWQGHPEAWMKGGQTVTAGPSDSWVIEFRVPPDEGAYLMLSHAVGSTSRGAIGVLLADRDAETPTTVLSEGPRYSAEEIEEMAEKAVRTISPFKPGTASNDASLAAADRPVVYGPEVEEVVVRIIGNSYYPKVIEIEPGTRVTWVNEDVFTYMSGEFSGIHNAVGIAGPEMFATGMLAHAESDGRVFTEPGIYEYICTPHPYMNGRIIVREPAADTSANNGGSGSITPLALALALGLGLAAVVTVRVRRRITTA